MYTREEKQKFSNVAESLKKYRRADLLDSDGKSVLDKLYVDLLDGDVILNKCLLDNTTFLIGRKGTGKSTIFLKLENEYRKKKEYLPCYVDVKTVYESSQAQSINQHYLQDYFDSQQLKKYLIGRNFIQSVLEQIYNEIDKQRRGIIDTLLDAIIGNKNDELKDQIKSLKDNIDNNSKFKQIEIPILQQIKIVSTVSNRNSEQNDVKCDASCNLSQNDVQSGISCEVGTNIYEENAVNKEIELTDIYLKIFDIKNVISQIKDILNKMKIKHLILLLDDVSEIDEDALKLFIDTVVSPLNNWSEEFIKFKIAFYPSRIHYGKIDPGKIDIINLDFYDLYSAFDINKMETNAVDFTRRLLQSRFEYYTSGIDKYFDTKFGMGEVYELFFKVSMNVPRIMGYVLAYLHQSVIIYDKRITRSDIENASERYYDEKIDAFFKASIYCLLSIDEKRDIGQLKKIRDAIVTKAKEIKKQIVSGDLSGKLYQKSHPYSSHFHILKESDKYIDSLELNHFITKYEERVNRDGKPTNIYSINYGLAKKNNIIWGKPKGNENRTYFIERPFNYTSLILEQIKEVKVIRCTNESCNRIFTENELICLNFTGYKCPDCHGDVIIESKVDDEVVQDLNDAEKLSLLERAELDILIELNAQNGYIPAKDIAEELDMNSRRIARICKKLSEGKGLVVRDTQTNPYKYAITEQGKKYCVFEECR